MLCQNKLFQVIKISKYSVDLWSCCHQCVGYSNHSFATESNWIKCTSIGLSNYQIFQRNSEWSTSRKDQASDVKIRFRHYAPHHSNNNSKDSNVDNGNDNDNGDKDSVFLSSNQKTYFSRVVCRRGKRDVDVEASDEGGAERERVWERVIEW